MPHPLSLPHLRLCPLPVLISNYAPSQLLPCACPAHAPPQNHIVPSCDAPPPFCLIRLNSFLPYPCPTSVYALSTCPFQIMPSLDGGMPNYTFSPCPISDYVLSPCPTQTIPSPHALPQIMPSPHAKLCLLPMPHFKLCPLPNPHLRLCPFPMPHLKLCPLPMPHLKLCPLPDPHLKLCPFPMPHLILCPLHAVSSYVTPTSCPLPLSTSKLLLIL